jgi:hypothetical protein
MGSTPFVKRFEYLQSTSGACGECGAPLKWAVVRGYATDPNSRASHRETWAVCQQNHETLQGLTSGSMLA